MRLDRWLFDLKRKRNIVTVLNLHRVSDEPDVFWPPLRRKTFIELLEYVAKLYDVCHLSSIGAAAGKRPQLVLSFDDGYLDFYENALPELRRMGMPSNHNVVIACVETNAIIWTQQLNQIFSLLRSNSYEGKLPLMSRAVSFHGRTTDWNAVHARTYHMLLQMKRLDRMSILEDWITKMTVYPPTVRMMNWDQVKKCLTSDVEIGSHSITHQSLSTLEPEDLDMEIVESRKILTAKLGMPCKTFSLPNGQYQESTMNVVRQAGYERVLLSNESFLTLPTETDQLLRVPRMLVVEEPNREMRLRIEGFHQLVKRGRL